MTTKTEFFAMLNDADNRVNETARVAMIEDSKGNVSVIVKQDRAPNFGLTNHRSAATANAAFVKFTAWMAEWTAAQNADVEAVAAEDDNLATFVIKGEGSFESELVAAAEPTMTYEQARANVQTAQDELVRLNKMLTCDRYQHIINGTFEGTQEQVEKRAELARVEWVRAKDIMNALRA